MLFPGSLQRHQGVDVAIHAFVEVKKNVPNAEFHIYGGSGGDMERLCDYWSRDSISRKA